MHVKWNKSQQCPSANTTLRANLPLVFSLAPMQQPIAESASSIIISPISSLLVQDWDQCTQKSFNTLLLTWKTRKPATLSSTFQSVFHSLPTLWQSHQQRTFLSIGLWIITIYSANGRLPTWRVEHGYWLTVLRECQGLEVCVRDIWSKPTVSLWKKQCVICDNVED